jgi:uncharacterized LabA/DUF88 family protein
MNALVSVAGPLALLIDGDNVAPSHAEFLLDFAASRGEVILTQAFGNSEVSSWRDVPGIKPIDTGKIRRTENGKNAADILLTIEAMDLLHEGRVRSIIIASSDSDFTHLAYRLREAGVRVIGLGQGKAPATFRAACSEFHPLPETTAPPPPQRPSPSTKVGPQSAFDKQIVAALKEHGGAMVWDSFTKLMAQRKILPKSSGHNHWRTYFTAREDLYILTGKGNATRISLRPG